MRRLPLMFVLSVALLAARLNIAPAGAQQRQSCFEQTSFCISGVILEYWERNGGLPVFGYPISEMRTETVENWTGPVQWFERDRLEDHSADNQGVLAGRLGVLALDRQGRRWEDSPKANGAIPGCRFFGEETGHSLCEPFLSYWEHNGGVERFGYPITEPVSETIKTDSGQLWSGSVQYFERRRMEHHTELQGAPILLGRLGSELQGSPPAPAAPPATADITGPKVGNDVYTFEIRVNSPKPQTIRDVDVFVYDPQHHVSYQETFPYQPNSPLTVDVPKKELKSGGSYTMVVRAKDEHGKNISTDDGKVDLAITEFGHTLAEPSLPKVEVLVGVIENNGGQETLPVTIKITDDSNQMAPYREFINGKVTIFHNNTDIYTYTFRPNLTNPLIKVPLAPGTLKADQQYEIVVEISAPDLAPISSEPYVFTPVLPPPPSFWQAYVEPVISDPKTIGGVLFVIFVVALVLIYRSQPRKRAIPNPVYSAKTFLSEKYSRTVLGMPKPHSTPMAFAQAQSTPRLKVSVVQTTDPAQRRETLVTYFPYVIGREGTDLLIPGDTKISRRHAEISAKGAKIIIKDLDTPNGTAFVVRNSKDANGSFAVKTRLIKGASVEWDNHSLIRLGPNTVLRLERLSSQ